MKFNKKMRGYDTAQVDKYLEELEKTSEREKEIRVSQKERIDQLTDENETLRQQVKKYQDDEQAISQSLIVSQNLAQRMKYDAEKYSDIVLTRAKIFYATWRAYSQIIISSLSAEEVAEFNKLQSKIEDIIDAYEGKDIVKEYESGTYDINRAEKVAATVTPQTAKSSGASSYKNPITKVERASEHTIEFEEINRDDLSLEDLCAELGLLTDKK
ncbi:MAG: DivIVA domain-containing protein [Clostridiales bacterium]|nr:DivIVA domain-containing protein [Clostridiales bacterium]